MQVCRGKIIFTWKHIWIYIFKRLPLSLLLDIMLRLQSNQNPYSCKVKKHRTEPQQTFKLKLFKLNREKNNILCFEINIQR